MKVLLVHNFYRQSGAEDTVFQAEKAMLQRMGHDVSSFVRDNNEINGMTRLSAAVATIWSQESRRELVRIIRESQPDVAHFHNTLMFISPSAYYACQEAGVPVVQTLHNYRLLCPSATFFRDGCVCEDCMRKTFPWPGIVNGCWRGSRTQTATVTSMLTLHRLLGTWHEQVDLYIALTDISREKFIKAGIPPAKIIVKPNFVDTDEFRGNSGTSTCRYALFVGRLSQKKGIETLLEAWKRIGQRLPLVIVGEGPMAWKVEEQAASRMGVEWVGCIHREKVIERMKQAELLIFLSVWFEGFPMTLVEAFSVGLPVIASRIGAIVEIVDHGRTGLNFEPGNAEDLAAKVEWILAHPEELSLMRRAARAEYKAKYAAERNYKMLMGIYETAIKHAREKSRI